MNNVNFEENKKLKISIIEDSLIHQEWLKSFIGGQPSLSLIDIAACGKQGIVSAKENLPDLVIVDFQLKDMTGLEVSKRIKAYAERTKIFILTAHTERSIIERLIEDKNIDAIGIKGSSYFEANFLPAIHRVCAGETYIDPSLLSKVRSSEKMSQTGTLSKREFEIFIQTNLGKSDLEIAGDLNVEVSHVKNMKSKILKKTKKERVANLLIKLIENA